MQFVPDAESIEFIMHTGNIIDFDCGKGLTDMRIPTFGEKGLPEIRAVFGHLPKYRNESQ